MNSLSSPSDEDISDECIAECPDSRAVNAFIGSGASQMV
jgi:hypothetical protein